METITTSLNSQQRAAIERVQGPVLVVAGAGTGKTRTLTQRAVHMIRDHGIPPENILAVTFTNRAAREMGERITNLLQGTGIAGIPFVGTFHNFCMYVLRRDIQRLNRRRDFIIYSRTEQETLLRNIMRHDRPGGDAGPVGEILDRISGAKAALLNYEDCAAGHGGQALQEVAPIFEQYEKRLVAANAMDFDDLLMLTVELIQYHPDAGDYWREHFPYILIDEYQDINEAQYMLVRELAHPNNNVFAIGDVDQAIYAFRGANVQNFMNFERDYSGAALFRLETNYRSSPEILSAAISVVEHNETRMEHSLVPSRPSNGPIMICNAPEEKLEAEWVLAEIERLLGGASRFAQDINQVDAAASPDAVYKFSDIAVLYRLNTQAGPIRNVLDRAGIPYRVVGAQNFTARREVRDALAYWRLAHNPDDDVSVQRILNTPTRGLGDRASNALADFSLEQGIPLLHAVARAQEIPQIKPMQAHACLKFAVLMDRLIREIKTKRAPGALDLIFSTTGLASFYSEDGVRPMPLVELANFAHQYDKIRDPGASRGEFYEDLCRFSEGDMYDPRAQAVSLMTLHASKGLEFPIVFITGAEKGLLPYDQDGSGGDVEEERRLFHVGMTRAMDRLFIAHTQSRFLFGSRIETAPSPYLDEIPEDVSHRIALKPRKKRGRPPKKPQLELF